MSTKFFNPLPGDPVYVGDRPASEMDLSIITYDTTSAQINHVSTIDELLPHQDDSKISWINISGLKDIDSINTLGKYFNIHPLSIEDILNTEQQPKIEIFGEYRFLSIKTIQREINFHHFSEGKKKFINKAKKTKENPKAIMDEFQIDQISIIIFSNVLITFQEIPGDSFDGVRKKILDGIGEIRNMGTDYLAYAIIDAIVDEYSLTLNHLEEDILDFEDRAAKTNDDKFIEEIQNSKKYLLKIKRAISPLKDNLLIISHREKFFQTDDLKPFIQDLNEHLNSATITVEHYREWLSTIMDINLSVLSHQMNKVMKVLATISTIFIPLTFIAGIYGMNFQFMPELGYKLAYPVVLSSMGLIALTMIVFFKFRRWF